MYMFLPGWPLFARSSTIMVSCVREEKFRNHCSDRCASPNSSVIYTKSAYRGKEHFMRRVHAVFASAALLAACPVLSASTINVVADASANEIGGKTTGTLPDSAAGIGGDGYILFAYNQGMDPTLTSGVVASGYASSYTVDATHLSSPGSYSTLSVGGGAEEQTGVAYQSVTAGATFTLMTFTLSSGTPSSFVVSVLQDNANGGGNNDLGGTIAITTTDTLGPQSTASQTLAGNGTGGSSDFYSFEVTNAAPQDKIAIVQTLPSAVSTAEFGGVAFQSVPEPASALMAGWGAAVLLLGRRRRSARRPTCRP
jgi:hypothetical protein